MSDRAAFEAAIAAAPDDRAPRLIYADWLEEQGEAAAASAVREAAQPVRMLSDRIKEILPSMGSVEHAHLRVESHPRAAAQFVYGKMYDAPPLNLPLLKRLGDLFGTDEIDVDDYAKGGCESCDYGSDYGHTIQVYNPTRYADELKALIGQALHRER